MKNIITTLVESGSLPVSGYEQLITCSDPEVWEFLRESACRTRDDIFGKNVYIRGLIEISNICKNNCYYCGIRRGNQKASRYRLTDRDILECAREGYQLGFRTFVLQGGEDPYFTDDVLICLIRDIKAAHPDCAITLSMGERTKDSYRALKAAGADRYLLRHETADRDHYQRLHPPYMSFDNRMDCLKSLKELGFQTGCGFMVGSPFQSAGSLAMDLKFIEEFKPHMCGIGPFIPHKDTPFGDKEAGSVSLTIRLLAIIRLIHPDILLPATTALGTLSPTGREEAILAGANVIMPNLSPQGVRKKYELYNNKLSDGDEAAQSIESIRQRLSKIGYAVEVSRGDYPGAL